MSLTAAPNRAYLRLRPGPGRVCGRKSGLRRVRRLPGRVLGSASFAIVLAACSSAVGPGGTPPPPPPPPPPAADFSALFAPGTTAEVDQVRTEWAARTPVASNVRVESTMATTFGQMPGVVTVLSHTLDGNRHYGAVFVPDAAPASAPIVLFLHAGEDGVSIPATDTDFLIGGLGAISDQVIYAIPSYRSEELRVGGQTFFSGGSESPWDRDVDDALAFLEATIDQIPQVDPSRLVSMGVSRGGLVSLLVGARDPRVDAVVELASPTDFFDPFVRNLVEQAANGNPMNLVGIDYLNEQFVQPWIRGEIPLSDVRRELVRRSAVLMAGDLPNVQLHHGTSDGVVRVSQAQSLIDAMNGLGRTPPAFEGFLYSGGDHLITTLAASPGRVGALLTDMWPPAPPAPSPSPSPSLTALFAAPTSAEISAVRTDWSSRNPASINPTLVQTMQTTASGVSGEIRVLQHTVDGAKHYGAVFVPNGTAAGSAAIIMFEHGGDGGVPVPGTVLNDVVATLKGLSQNFIYVFPSFRSESLRVGGNTYVSTGAPSPWDRDVDDALALMQVVIATVPEANPSRIAAIGVSRGGLVAQLMAARDGRIDGVVPLASPTDFFDPWVQGLFTLLLAGQSANRAGLDVINQQYLQPWAKGQLSLADMRRQMVRRSVVLFASAMPDLQLHHGTSDPVVQVSQAQRMISKMTSLGRVPPVFAGFLYQGGTHNTSTFQGSGGRIQSFIGGLWP